MTDEIVQSGDIISSSNMGKKNVVKFMFLTRRS